MSTTGVTYYKLEKGYPGDITKGCGLTGSEIDKNFHFLRGYDIRDAVVEEDGKIVFTRVNGDEMVVTGLHEFVESIEDAKINEELSYFDKDRYELHIVLSYSDGTNADFVIDGFRLERDKIYVGPGLFGDGGIDNPLHLNPVYETGFFRPVKEFLDFSGKTEEFGLPEGKDKGDRYLTREKTTKYGLKYNTAALNDIMARLGNFGKGWRVPTADDWNSLLNAYEDCNYMNHGSSIDSGYYGFEAGRILKDLSWPDSEPEYAGVGFKVLPTDHDDNGRLTTSFWSSTTDKIKEITTKTFRENNGKIYQRGKDDQESTYSYIRLVRDMEDGQYQPVETIDGIPYDCVQLSSVTSNGVWSTKIWTVENAYFSKYFTNGNADGMNALRSEFDTGIDNGEDWYYYINEWDGHEWLKKRLDINDVIVIEKYEGEPDNSEFVVTEDGLVNRTDKIVDSVREEVEADIAALNVRIDELDEKLDEEIANRLSGETAIYQKIEENEEIVADALNDLNDRISGLTNEIYGIVDDFKAEVDRLDNKINDAVSSITENVGDEVDRLDNKIDDAVSSITETINNEVDRLDNKIDDAVSSITETIDNEVERLDSRIDTETEERKQNDVDFARDYVMEVVGGVDLYKVNGDKVNIAFDGDFSKYNPNEAENGWTLFSE